MKILFLANCNPAKPVKEGNKYAFFRYWPDGKAELNVLGTFKVPFYSDLEKMCLKFYFLQSCAAYFFQFKYDLIMVHGTQSAVFLALLRSLIPIKYPPMVVFDIEAFGRIKNGFKYSFLKKAVKSIDLVTFPPKTVPLESRI